MWKTVLLQIGATLLVVVGAEFFAGERGAISASFGGASYVLPNLLFVASIKTLVADGKATVTTFVVGEFGKVVGTIVILIAVQQYYGGVHWLAMCLGLFAALKANLFALFLVKT